MNTREICKEFSFHVAVLLPTACVFLCCRWVWGQLVAIYASSGFLIAWFVLFVLLMSRRGRR